MAMEYKKILLHKGLKMLTDYQFRTVRCLLADELQLTSKMREDSDRIMIAERMFSKFPGAASVDKLIDTLKDDPELKEFVDSLRKEKQNVKRRLRTAGERARSRQQDGAGPSAPLSSPDGPRRPQGAAEDSVAQKRKHNTEGEKGVKKNKGAQMSSKAPYPVGASPSRTQTATGSFSPDTKNYPTATPIFQLDKPSILPTMPSSVSMASSTSLTESPSATAKVAEGRKTPSQGPVTVLVLERSEVFNFMEQGQALMFHATVATASQFYWVKVFDDTPWHLFTENAVLTISGHSMRRGTLEVSKTSIVSPTIARLKVPKSVMKRACEPPKIDDLCKAVSGTPVYGRYKVVKKTQDMKNTIYEIKDKTGSIEVVGSGQWCGLPCEPGDQLQLFCLRVSTVKKKTSLMCEKHSLIQVVQSL
ncbi:myeloid cell nuclear differentiation antigen [Sorex fumeus]|uniref:myeloid cell nuclear differentiation antigen n=1 Tax=Sorex fumeus TaxID=62283 RepID=UPI0024ACAA34|nr:myeloid cell nuclear differentiation antigen [Sorex fumeus]XP_055965544.1 myeloid cell nuclear differentiation antigen [Sorex fumeus]